MERAREQHRGYQEGLRNLGVQVLSLPVEPHLPDAVIVEDVAVVLDEVAVGAPSGPRRLLASRPAEVTTVAANLGCYRPLRLLEDPGHVEGGNVLRLGENIIVPES